MKKLVNLIFMSLLVFTSCEDDLDINTNPNTPPGINKGLALSAAEGSLSTVVGGELFNLGGFFSQYYTQAPSASQYEALDQYNLNTDYANRLWTELYAGALNDLQFVLERSMEEGDTGTYLMATVLRAYTYQYLVDMFGAVPYTDALQGNENIAPAPTPGKEIYLDLIASINEALAQYEANPAESDVGAQDIFLGGDMENWVEFANTLKLRLYLRMAYTPEFDCAAVTALLNENNFLDQNVAFGAFSDATSKRNPYYEVQIERLGNVNAVASNSLFEFYDRNSDPRLTEVYTTNDEGEYVAIPQGSGLLAEPYGGTLANEYSRPDIEPTTPVYLMTVPESLFLQAEAVARCASGAGAENLYNQGIAASFELYGVEGADEFTAPGGVYEYDGSGSIEEDVEQIIVQKWASLANFNNIEAWIEARRTGYPLLTTEDEPEYEEGRRIVSLASVLAGNEVPLSLFYPDNEVQRNTNITQKPDLTEEVWWNQK